MARPRKILSIPMLCVLALLCAMWVSLPVARSFAQTPATPMSEKDYPLNLDEKAPTGGQPSSDNLGASALRMFGSTAVVLGLIALIAWLVRRFAPRSAGVGRSDVIHVIGTKMLGGRRSLTLVRVRGQTLLLGITPQSIQCLTEIHEVEGEWAQPPDSSASSFDRQLGRILSSSVESPKKS